MANSASKAQFITNMQTLANGLESDRAIAEQLVNMYFNAGFNAGGANPIVDVDVTGNGLTAAKVTAMVTLLQQLARFFGNQAVTTGAYQTTNDQMRTS